MDPNDDDLNLIQRIKVVPIIKAKGADFAGYVAEDALTPEIRSLMEDEIVNIKYSEVEGDWHLFATDWHAAVRRMLSVLNARMRLRSLELGVVGPSSNDLETAPTFKEVRRCYPITQEMIIDHRVSHVFQNSYIGFEAAAGLLVLTPSLSPPPNQVMLRRIRWPLRAQTDQCCALHEGPVQIVRRVTSD